MKNRNSVPALFLSLSLLAPSARAQVGAASGDLANASGNLAGASADVAAKGLKLSADIAIEIGKPLVPIVVNVAETSGEIVAFSYDILSTAAVKTYNASEELGKASVELGREIARPVGKVIKGATKKVCRVVVLTAKQTAIVLEAIATKGAKLTAEAVTLLAQVGIDSAKLAGHAALAGVELSTTIAKTVAKGSLFVISNTGEHLVIAPLEELTKQIQPSGK